MSNIYAAVIATQKVFKDTARSTIHSAYGLHPDLQDTRPDAEVVIKQSVIPQLLNDEQWLHQWDMVRGSLLIIP